METPRDTRPTHSQYGAVESPMLDFEMIEDFDYDLTNPAPFLTPDHKRWSVLEKLNRNHICQIRNCHDLWKMFTCKCFFSTFMLIASACMLALLVKVMMFNNSILAPSYDFIIVGGGTSGCVLARRLSDEGARVLLLEAGQATQAQLGGHSNYGSRMTNFDIPLLWSVGSELTNFSWKSFQNVSLGKGLGGMGVFGSMVYLRATPQDIDSWGLPDWTWERMLESYKSLEAFTADSGSQAAPPHRGLAGHIATGRASYIDQLAPQFIKAAAQAGHNMIEDFNNPHASREGAGYYQFMTKNGVRVSTATALLAPIMHELGTKISVQLDALVTSISINTFDANKLLEKVQKIDKTVETTFAAYGVEYSQYGVAKQARLAYRKGYGQRRDFGGRRCVILAGGAVMTPKLLMSSGVGDPELLQAAEIPLVVENRFVGKNLADQVMLTLLFPANPVLASSYTSMYNLADQWSQYLAAVEDLERPGAETVDSYRADMLRSKLGVLSNPGFSAGAFFSSPFAVNATGPDLQVAAFPAKSLTAEESAAMRSTGGAVSSTTIGVTLILLRPEHKKELHLAPNDPSDFLPRVIPEDFDLSSRDVSCLAWGVKQVRRIMRAAPLANSVGEEVSPGAATDNEQLRQWIQAHAQRAGHWAGSVRMGDNPLTSASDTSLRVRGLDAVRVVDASVLPTLPTGNVEATAQAVANIAADIILDF